MKNSAAAVMLFFLLVLPFILPAQTAAEEDTTAADLSAVLKERFPDISLLYIQAVAETPRKPFIPDSFLSLAGTDMDIPVLRDAILPAPGLTLQIMSESGVRPGASVLIAGKAGGYLGAAAAALTEKVTVVEFSEELFLKYPGIFGELGIDTITLVNSLAGAAESGFMYDIVILHGGTPVLPPEISSFLRPSGVLIVPISGRSGYQNLLKIQYGNGLTVRSIGESFFPLVGELFGNY
jgi:protein-L-isoaspartate O-methyltransferase